MYTAPKNIKIPWDKLIPVLVGLVVLLTGGFLIYRKLSAPPPPQTPSSLKLTEKDTEPKVKIYDAMIKSYLYEAEDFLKVYDDNDPLKDL